MGECARWGLLTAVLYFELYHVLGYLFCSYFWKEVFVICTDAFLLSLSVSTRGSLYLFSEGRSSFDYFCCVSIKFLFSYFSF